MNRKARCPTCGEKCNVLYYQTKMVDAAGRSIKEPSGRAKVQWHTMKDWWVCAFHPQKAFHEVVPDTPEPPESAPKRGKRKT